MINRAFWMFLIAVLLAVGAAFLANRWLEAARLSAEHTDELTTPLVVAALKIPFATKIEAIHVKTLAWPRASAPEGAFSELDQVIGKVANQTILANEPVLKDRVAEHLGGSTLSAFIERNKRAVSVRVNDVTGVGGFVLPGNQVDVLEARKGGISRILLQNVKVLAVDQEASPDKDKPAIVKAVTLELTPEQSEILVEATQEGSIHLALRNPLDDQLLAQAPSPPPPLTAVALPAKQPPAQEPQKHSRFLTVVRGDKTTVYEGR
ncbi:MAG: pilus assembly protein CpaB [Pseudomonadota bacterium]|nr:pilus assembly protein CpaB [Pseudomonadota bacterium]